MADKDPNHISAPSCCVGDTCPKTNKCTSSACVLQRVDNLILVDRFGEAKDVLKWAVDQGSECDKVRGKYDEVCCILERRNSAECCRGVDNGDGACGESSGSCMQGNGRGVMDEDCEGEGGKVKVDEELECVLCLKLLYEPVTTSCGHTFCKMCLARVIDYTSACPLCRAVLHLDDPTQLPQSVVLSRVIQRWHPKLYAERKREMQLDPCLGETFTIPLFSLNSVVFPGSKFPMHIFEPRYRLMLRRVMAGARKFGLVKYKRDEAGNAVPADIGALLEVESAERTPDGRSIIDTIGIGRFRILERRDMDGYTVAKVQRYYDTCGLEGEEVTERARKARKCIQDMLAKGGRCPTMQNALQRTGPVPDEDKGPSALSLWLAGALVEDLDERQRLLEMCDANARLKEMSCCLERYHRSRFCPYTGFVRNRECVMQ